LDILTIHLNDYFQCNASGSVVPRRYWARFQSRIENNTLRLLDLLDHHGCRATFFTSGWIADRVPALIAEIADRGHEIASTGYYQHLVSNLSADELRSEAVQSRIAIERASGREVIGYRCAGWLKPKDLWALEILAEEGFRYDSSFYYFGFGGLGARIEKPTQFVFGRNRIWEVPIPSGNFLGFRFPIAGGTYLRQLPQKFIYRQIELWHEKAPGPWVIYFQVAELDPDQPRITALPILRSIQKYRNITEMQERVTRYLERSNLTSISTALGIEIPMVAAENRIAKTIPTLTERTSGKERLPITIVVPCFQEVDSIPYLSNALKIFEVNHADKFAIHYVFVDDGSRDRTHALLIETFGGNASASILKLENNRGITAAMLTGIRNAPTETVCVIDCDCSYSPETLAAMIPELREGIALVTASPYHRDGSVVNLPRWRLFLSRGLSFLYRRVLNTRIATYTSCCRVYRRSAIVDLDVTNDGFLGVIEIIVRLDERGEKIVEMPAVLEARVLGASKMKTARTIIAHTRSLLSLVARRLGRRLALLPRVTPP
jgi:polysaccharide deacetylase family protein (PEP-CTERM system associated)